MAEKRLVDYIKEQLDAGYTRGEITTHLIRGGHPRADVEKAFEKAISKKTHISQSVVELLSIVLLALLIFWIGMTSEAPGVNVIAGFLPSILSILFFISVVETGRHEKYLWGMPFLLVIIFVILGELQVSVFGLMEVYKLGMLNLVLSYLALVLISYPEAYRKTEHEEKPSEISDIKHTFQSIEDKCKAINFVIGRVYRSSNGGTTKLRDNLRVGSELYNEFDRVVKEGTREEQLVALDKIGDVLLKLQKSEKDVLGPGAIKHLKNILRNDDGTSKIIDVLANNDNDPVMLYYNGALEAYHNLRRKFESK
ncbi:hypothetical protein KY308_01180 [Candidatus Woesearchaeota archaeon]|nr:hypothetical protein [Candidatus Woesearchaeota archaeon]